MKTLILLFIIGITFISCEKTEVKAWDSYQYQGTKGSYIVEFEFTGKVERTVNTEKIWTKNVSAPEGFNPSIKVVSKQSKDTILVSIIKNGNLIYIKEY